MMGVIFQNSNDYTDTFGPFHYTQVTYDILRVGCGDGLNPDDQVLAHLDSDGLWHLRGEWAKRYPEKAWGAWSDIVFVTWEETHDPRSD